MRLSSLVPFALAFGVASVGAYGAAQVAVRLLESNSQADVAFQMELQGFDWTEVQADGLQVILSGEAPSEAVRFNALSVSGSVIDAARIIDNMSVQDTQQIVAPRFSVEILRNEAGVSLIGLIPAETDRDAVVARVERAAGGASVTDLLEVADYATPENWDRALDYALDALNDLPRSKVSVEAGSVAIQAITDSEAEKRRLEGNLSRLAPDNVRAALTISAPRPVITPFTLRFLIDQDGPRFDACSADTQAAQRKVLAAAIAAGLNDKSECRLGLGSPTASWGDAAARSILAVQEMGSGSVTMSDADITLIAAEGTDETLFNRVSASLERDLPDIFALTAVLPEPAVEGEAGPAELLAILSPEGQVQVRGHTGDDLATGALRTYAQARFGADDIYLAQEEHPDLPEGWPIRTLAGLAALAELKNGSVTIEAEALTVRGTTGNKDARARIAQVLSDQLGEGQTYSINVTYDEKLDPTANIPTAEECAAEVQAIAQAGRIKFEPGSATLDGDSQDTISKIADVVTKCPDLAMLVEGHTDSQGREEMNLALSQTRAEAVIAALRAKRLAVSNFRAQGFGEVNPIADNGTEEGREANRRIAFKIITEATETVSTQQSEGTQSE